MGQRLNNKIYTCTCIRDWTYLISSLCSKFGSDFVKEELQWLQTSGTVTVKCRPFNNCRWGISKVK